MNRDEFTALPQPLALRLLWDALPEGARAALEETPAPQVPRPPKYDTPIFRSTGVTYASEYDAEGLRYWRDRSREGGDPKYAEANEKRAKALGYWIEYRAFFPHAPWTGERNHQTVSAAAPSSKPREYPREQRGSAGPAKEAKPLPGLDDDNSEIPF